ncbi:hypothetical protein BJ138DRAFT_1117436 [Hygrophoropsis aurantiaca]|uniref:Uncharacterized protein n=1 Tax=Hygrophoropsis aurantiaca TaxID=72124 RepID=A0ACB8A0D9_9AGAM|nr:hypothetical protein BJ138DRAFT_1117436 [Hygrophoropsis aurantiaca]
MTDNPGASECLVERVELCRRSSSCEDHEFLVVQIRHKPSSSLALLKLERSVKCMERVIFYEMRSGGVISIPHSVTYTFDDSVTCVPEKISLPESWGDYNTLYTLDFDLPNAPSMLNLATLVSAMSQWATHREFCDADCYSYARTMFVVLNREFEGEEIARKASKQRACCTGTIEIRELVSAATNEYKKKWDKFMGREKKMEEEKARDTALREVRRQEQEPEIEELRRKLEDARRQAAEAEKKYEELVEKDSSGKTPINSMKHIHISPRSLV